jgi:eukaryotic-like serine/threonine-protein kinase
LPDPNPACPTCGASIPANAPGGKCPVCLFQLGLTPPPSEATPLPFTPALPARFGDHELLEEIARGGMGVVYKARQLTPERTVALKVIQPHLVRGEAALRRFMQEAEAASRLDHPNIVPVFQAGVHDEQPFYTMRLIQGGSLASRLGPRDGASQSQTARLMAKVARAIHHAHQRGVLHRDLKPANILLEDCGEPFVTDFGLAKLEDGSSVVTGTDHILGTPGYMAPEQADPARNGVTCATDIYSLGAILYHQLAGRPPCEADTPVQTLRLVLEQDPQPPSRFNPVVDRDLETICLKCLERTPHRRYHSAGALADDLERWLRGEPISARPVTGWERAVKWSRRRPAMAALLVVSVCGTLAFLGQMLWSRDQIRQERDRAVAEREKTETARKNAVIFAQRALQQRERAEEALRRQDLQRAEELLAEGDSSAGLAYLAGALHQDPTNAVLAQRLLNALSTRPLALPAGPPVNAGRFVHTARFSPDGRLLATARLGVLQLWNPRTGARVGPPRQHPSRLACFAFSPDGTSVVCGTGAGGIVVWPVLGPGPLRSGRPHDTAVTDIAFNPAGTHFLSFSEDGTALLHERETGALVWTLRHGGPIHRACFSRDGRWIVTASADRTARVWDAATGRPRSTPLKHAEAVKDAQFNSDATRLVTGGADRFVKIWEIDTGRLVGTPARHETSFHSAFFALEDRCVVSVANGGEIFVLDAATGHLLGAALSHGQVVTSVDLSPDGRLLATAGGALGRLWDLEARRPVAQQLVHPEWVRSIRFGLDGRLVTTSNDGTVRTWEAVKTADPPMILPHEGGVVDAMFSFDGRRVLTGSGDRTARVWDASSGRPALPPMRHAAQLVSARFDADGRRIATASKDRTARVWDAATGEPLLEPLPHEETVTFAEWSRDGTRLATGAADGTVKVWDATTGRLVGEPLRHAFRVTDLAFHPQSTLLAVTAGNEVTLCDARTGERSGLQLTHSRSATSVAFSPDGAMLLTGGVDGRARLWDLVTGALLADHFRQDQALQIVRFNGDGRRIVTAGARGGVCVWERGTGKLVAGYGPHEGRVTAAEFSPDGERLLTASEDGTARLWDVASGLPLTDWIVHGTRVVAGRFSPDGRSIVTASWDGTARVLHLPPWTGPVPEWLPGLAEAVGGRRLDHDHALRAVPAGEFLELKEELLAGQEPHAMWVKRFFGQRHGDDDSPQP